MADGTGAELAPWPALFAPEERLGWSFSDRDQFRRAFTEPRPPEAGPPVEVDNDRLQAARRKLPGRLAWTWRFAFVGTVAAWAVLVRHDRQPGHHLSPAPVLIYGGVGAAVAGGLWLGLVLTHLRLARRSGTRRQSVQVRRQGAALQAWSARRAAFEEQETQRLSSLPQWVSAPAPGHRRIDVVGGNLWGWEAFLTVFGASALASRGPMVVLDLSGEQIVGELARGAVASGLDVDVQALPGELADSDLLAGLDVPALVEIFVESLHGGDSKATRGERVLDARLLGALCDRLAAGGLTMPRIAAGARVLLNEPYDGQELSESERADLAGQVFSASYREQSSGSLRVIEALADSLGGLGLRTHQRPPADLRCVSMAATWRSGAGDFLADLVVAWAARQIAADAGSGSNVATLVLAGADELAPRHLERLSDLCNRRGTRLVVMFRHLRETSFQMLGAGPVAFMNLGNPQEAARAADFIGREHRFEISGLTRTVGGHQTHSVSDSDGGSEGLSQSAGKQRGTTSAGLSHAPTRSWGRSWSQTRNTDRNWAHSTTDSNTDTWSDAQTTQRVYEYAVEPRVLQQLPDYAMVLVEHAPTGVQVKAVEINPDIPLLQPTDDTGAGADQAPQIASANAGARQALDEPVTDDVIGPWPNLADHEAVPDRRFPQE
ncbi:hypothetical protein [Catenulispora rubra]|uniref:hypothetical protein n=1 Tax=Catenulispora rubra TaxID=280293 RepID=UPI0018921E7F|nr:hypothetical protein [Catenulispora rubra]